MPRAQRIAQARKPAPDQPPRWRGPLPHQHGASRSIDVATRAAVADVLSAPGQPLDASTRAYMEPRFGHDFSRVRVHADARAATTAAALRASAYTAGQDIAFAAGRYAPMSAATRRLLAHELAHVVQHEARPPATTFLHDQPLVTDPADPAEVEAESIARQVTAAGPVPVVVSGGGTAGGALARSTDTEDKEREETVNNMTNSTDLAWKFLSTTNPDMSEGIGAGFESVNTILQRVAKGQGSIPAVGGGLVSALQGGIVASSGPKKALEEVESNKGLSGGMSLAGSALKFLGGVLGEKSGPDIGLGDIGTYLDTAAKFANPEELAKQGIKEGFGGAYDTLQSFGSYLATGSTDAFIKQNEANLRNGENPITQGYSMIANLIGSTVTGDSSEMDHIEEMAEKGELGPLAKLGTKLGDVTFDAVQGAKKWGGRAGDWLSDTASGTVDWFGDKAGAVGGWLSDTASSVSDTASSAVSWASDRVGGAADWVEGKAGKAKRWITSLFD